VKKLLWDEIIRKSENSGAVVKYVYQEEVQKSVLAALAIKGCFNNLVFQGGTALRLFYNNPRFSEDIDLVLKEGEKRFELSNFLLHIEKFVHNTFPFLESVEVRSQKIEQDLQRFILRTFSINHDQDLRLHIELASIPSYINSPKILEFPPTQPVVRVEEPLEILADKVCALAFRQYLKGRDLWDIYYLTKERNIDIKWELVRKKVLDYKEPISKLEKRFNRASKRIKSDGVSILGAELERFLPKHVLDSYRSLYDPILDSVVELIAKYNAETVE
jgi:predicted nucleotidyltransferase component of viral defense system